MDGEQASDPLMGPKDVSEASKGLGIEQAKLETTLEDLRKKAKERKSALAPPAKKAKTAQGS